VFEQLIHNQLFAIIVNFMQLTSILKMESSGMLRSVALVRTDVTEEFSASTIRVTTTAELGTTLAVSSNRRRLLVTANVVPSSAVLV
jgi:hypothetical protein